MTVSHILPIHPPPPAAARRNDQDIENEGEENTIYDVIIVGAGPCGLAVAARLQEETPSAMFTDEEHQRYHWIRKHSGRMNLVRAHNRKMKGVKAERYVGLDDDDRDHCVKCKVNNNSRSRFSTLVLDSTSDRWMERWNRSFRMLEIDHLRSPMFFHVDPGDRDGLLAYTRENGREGELCELSGCVGHELSKHKRKKMRSKTSSTPREVEIDERDRKDYFTPSTQLFADYCSSIVARYGLDSPGQILQSEVQDIQFGEVPGLSTDGKKLFTLSTSRGTFYSRAVVLAVGPGHAKMLPWELSPEEQMGACHNLDIGSTFPSPHVRKKIKQGLETNVVVVGGGLSSAQVVDMAVRKGVTKVWHLVRGDLKVKHFDVSLNWVGKFRNYEKAVFWSADSDAERFQMLQTARNGGSITPRFQKILKQHIARQRLSIYTRTVITDKHFDPVSKTWRLTTDPPIADLPPRIDYIYFATGVKADVRELPLLRSMNRDYPIEVLHGLPCLTDDLMWKPDVPLFVTGRLAALRLGPAGPNLEGARLGAERVAWALDAMFGDGKKDRNEPEEPLQKAFCGLGNRYAGLAEV